ncbi:hypothetical protein BDV27DRAFT_156934 [Aspergillus caelatus]|uniref:Uncharacterized protein n=1 Tax=Aspergillus caelatus TaxID=61420 RepID=A0A5N7A6G0_9EURO|nr:uncharacterized protein BDV27DRAFT_156934 [Aspergillus caelatus]KAE8365444.1 hypothetical protein BDV27DRAFT_156934 [Aspergillus caelatus]
MHRLFIGTCRISDDPAKDLSQRFHWTLIVEASFRLQGVRRFHACCGIESELDEHLSLPAQAPGYFNQYHPIREQLVVLQDEDESFEKFGIGHVGDVDCLLGFLRTFKEDPKERPSSCYHWLREAIEYLKENDVCDTDLRERWLETRELLDNGPNMYHNARGQDGMGLGIDHYNSESQNDTSQHITHQSGMSSDGISIEDINIDEITSRIADHNATTPDKISLDGLTPDFIQYYSLDTHPMVQNAESHHSIHRDSMNVGLNRQNTMRYRAINQNIPPQNSITCNTTDRYNPHQSHMGDGVVSINSMGQSSDNQNCKKHKGKKHGSKWCCFSGAEDLN